MYSTVFKKKNTKQNITYICSFGGFGSTWNQPGPTVEKTKLVDVAGWTACNKSRSLLRDAGSVLFKNLTGKKWWHLLVRHCAASYIF